jgi:hypothetical protein
MGDIAELPAIHLVVTLGWSVGDFWYEVPRSDTAALRGALRILEPFDPITDDHRIPGAILILRAELLRRGELVA